MTIPWPSTQAQVVSAAIDAHPPESGQCAALARQLVPEAQQIDRDATGVVIRPKPGRGRFVVLKGDVEYPWRHHVTTRAEVHCVDALTGPGGMPDAEYREELWAHHDMLEFQDSKLEEPWL